MKLSADLTVKKLADIVCGQVIFPPLPPLGGSWEPIHGVTAITPTLIASLQTDDLKGAAVWLVGVDAQTAWWSSQVAFSAGALVVVSEHSLVPRAGRACIQAAELEAANGMLGWCHSQLTGFLGVVLRESRGPGEKELESVVCGDELVRFAVDWLLSTPGDDVVVELSIEKKTQLLQQFVLPCVDFLGIYSLAIGAHRPENLLNEILSFVASSHVSWLPKSSPIMLAPECWNAPPLDHPEWSRLIVKSPGANYENWIDELRSQQHIAEISSFD
ncbi:MAG TPA: hypothetical protein EYG57_14035 [Planctomycetes bacterium]|nr:hypothetical protein [Planctomycetaceae bacterium]HIM30650.1 hypothetical protein [Planctomycetota bacterium]